MASTIVLCALVILGLGGALVLFLSLKQEMRAGSAKSRRKMEALVKSMEERLVQASAAQPASEPIYIPANPSSGMNITKRVLAMRMVRRNEDISHIAVALGVSQREVELLIRVHRLSAEAARVQTPSQTRAAAAGQTKAG
jgi:hypothetical protein